MDYAQTLGQVMGPVYLLLGLSFLIYPKVWRKVVEYFAKDHLHLLPMVLMYLVLGLISVNLYSDWSWNVWLLVTLTGWGMLLKGVFYLLVPGKTISRLLEWEAKHLCFYTAGTVVLVMGLVLSYFSYI